MNSYSENQPDRGRIIGATVLAIALGLALPVVTMLQVMSLCPVILLGGVFTAFLQCWAGWIPACVFIAAQLASSLYLTGPALMAMELLAAVLPAALLIHGMHRNLRFFDQLRRSLLLYFAGMVAAVFVAYASFGSGMIQRFMDLIRDQLNRMPDAALVPFVNAVNATLATEGAGLSGITLSDYRATMMAMLDLMQQTYGQLLPGALLSGALISAVLTVLWGNWRLAMRGMATAHSFVGMTGWHLPGYITAGTLILWIVSFAMAQGGIASGPAVYATVHQIACYTFAFQALASMDRRYTARGMTVRRRKVLIGLLLALALIFRDIATILMIVGICSALFGGEGLIRRFLHKNDNDDADF